MTGSSAAQRRAPNGAPGRWFEKPGSSPADRIPAFREALQAVATAWQDKFKALAAIDGEITLDDVAVCKVDDVAGRRGQASILATLVAPGWNTRIGIHFDRIFVTTMVEALFGGAGEDLEASAAAPLSPVDRQIADVTVQHVAEALTAGFAKCLPSTFAPEGIQPRVDSSFLGKPSTAVVVGTLALAALGNVVRIDILVPLAAMMVFADELAISIDVDPSYEDPRWTQRLESEVGRSGMSLLASVDLDPMRISALTALQKGQVIELPKGSGQRVRLSCGGDDLFLCELGQAGGFYTVRVEETVGAVPAAPEPDPPPFPFEP